MPPPLPPETRTVGQLVAESVRLYGGSFWRSVGLGVGPALVGVALAEVPTAARLPLLLTAGAAVASLSYACASAFASGTPLAARRIARAVGIGILVVEPAAVMVGFLSVFGLLPAVAWLGFIGL